MLVKVIQWKHLNGSILHDITEVDDGSLLDCHLVNMNSVH